MINLQSIGSALDRGPSLGVAEFSSRFSQVNVRCKTLPITTIRHFQLQKWQCSTFQVKDVFLILYNMGIPLIMSWWYEPFWYSHAFSLNSNIKTVPQFGWAPCGRVLTCRNFWSVWCPSRECSWRNYSGTKSTNRIKGKSVVNHNRNKQHGSKSNNCKLQIWPFEPAKESLCFLRSPLEWIMQEKTL